MEDSERENRKGCRSGGEQRLIEEEENQGSKESEDKDKQKKDHM
jgi:hypothetical protein